MINLAIRLPTGDTTMATESRRFSESSFASNCPARFARSFAMPSRNLLLIASALVVIAGTAAVASKWPGQGGVTPIAAATTSAPEVLVAAATPAVTREVPQGQGQVQLSFAPVVKEVAPAVVNV